MPSARIMQKRIPLRASALLSVFSTILFCCSTIVCKSSCEERSDSAISISVLRSISSDGEADSSLSTIPNTSLALSESVSSVIAERFKAYTRFQSGFFKLKVGDLLIFGGYVFHEPPVKEEHCYKRDSYDIQRNSQRHLITPYFMHFTPPIVKMFNFFFGWFVLRSALIETESTTAFKATTC